MHLADLQDTPKRGDITKKEFAKAMQRLLDAKVIEIRTLGKAFATNSLSSSVGRRLKRATCVQRPPKSVQRPQKSVQRRSVPHVPAL